MNCFPHNVPSMSALTLMFFVSGAAMTSCTNSTNRSAAREAEPAQQVESSAVRARADVAAAVEKMKAMVANGEITEEQMEQRLNRMAVKIRGDQGDKTKVQPAAATDAAPCCASQKKVAPAATSDAKGECPFSNR